MKDRDLIIKELHSLKSSHMLKSMDGECTKEDVVIYQQKYAELLKKLEAADEQ